MTDIEPGIYRHYKGNIYKLLFIAKHTETMEDMCIYVDTKDEKKIWARPASMWNEEVTVGGKTVKRFTKIDESPRG